MATASSDLSEELCFIGIHIFKEEKWIRELTLVKRREIKPSQSNQRNSLNPKREDVVNKKWSQSILTTTASNYLGPLLKLDTWLMTYFNLIFGGNLALNSLSASYCRTLPILVQSLNNCLVFSCIKLLLHSIQDVSNTKRHSEFKQHLLCK